MDELKKALKRQARIHNQNTSFVSISALNVGRRYRILDLSKVQSKFGLRLLVSLEGDNMVLKTYLPKSIKLNDSYINEFNSRDRKTNLFLIYKGTRTNGSYNIDFE
ncbi:uncharacterized protein LOC112688588 [Sipha flava]|jgi:hypothetical protein|uniref:Uncharacterized protein LOC112688588 n=1 Tax=Sipha flava TaxID=143950 RepID=A0A2S2QNK9_9HEMI|nr:uncharacterized protein LOC112688588 [Sipha flava]XP_025417646.1 uncharacterized protein LOC112688588 [Sipha flava]